MSKKKLLASLFLPLLLASFLQSQSLAELAKKEKERRAALKGKATTVTTADIAKVKKRPAVESTEDQTAERARPRPRSSRKALLPSRVSRPRSSRRRPKSPPRSPLPRKPPSCPPRTSRRSRTSWPRSPSRRTRWSSS